jgi:sterol desaturase/sphingolipid hydroxylase (fatty acid hydroxylase superfamily)
MFLFITNELYAFLWGSIPGTAIVEIVYTVIIIDILYYFYHRAHHRYSKLFTVHRIHHAGTKYNLALAIMLPWVGQASIYLMLIPLVLLHIAPVTIISGYFFVLTYQFFCHISYLQVPKGFNYFLITPNNHRVHHYDDRYGQSHNFGAVLSIWDRLFSTYLDPKVEKEEVFGIAGNTHMNFLYMQKKAVVQFFRK